MSNLPGDMMPSAGIWYVEKTTYGSSCSNIFKLAELPDVWPLVHYAGYEKQITKDLLGYINSKEKGSVSIQEVVEFVLKSIATQYVEQRDIRFADKKIVTIKDLQAHLEC